MYLILSLDGGGIRGILTARILERLEAEVPFLHKVRLFAGTSTGGILALALAKGFSPTEIVKLYEKFGEQIFGKRDWIDKITHLDELTRADFSHEGLRAALDTVFGQLETLGDLPKNVVIPTFDLDNQDEISKSAATRAYKARYWKPKFMHNFDGVGNDKAVRVISAALRTSSAPTYFPSFEGYVDGGVVDNNPAMSALAKAVKHGAWIGRDASLLRRLKSYMLTLDTYQAKDFVTEIDLQFDGQAKLLSVGTGFNPHYIEGKEHDYGYRQWLTGNRLLNMLFDGMIGPPDYMARQFLDRNYRRINPVLHEVIDLADYERIPELLEVADNLNLDKEIGWLQGCLSASS